MFVFGKPIPEILGTFSNIWVLLFGTVRLLLIYFPVPKINKLFYFTTCQHLAIFCGNSLYVDIYLQRSVVRGVKPPPELQVLTENYPYEKSYNFLNVKKAHFLFFESNCVRMFF